MRINSAARILIACFLHLSCAVYILQAQTEQYKFKKLGIEDGLPFERFYSVKKDDRGYLWFAGSRGIFRYDGRKFDLQGDQYIQKSINTTFDLAIDHNGRPWGNSFYSRVYYISNDSVILPGFSDSLYSFLKEGQKQVNQIGFDKDNRLWIGTTLSMVVAEPGESYSKMHLHHEFSDSANTVIKVLGDGLAIMSKNRLELPNAFPKGNGVRDFPGGYSINCQVIFGNGVSRMIVLRRQSSDRYVPTGESIELKDGSVLFSIGYILYHVFQDGSFSEKQYDEQITTLYQDQLNNLWIGVSGGIYCHAGSDLNSKPEQYLAGINGINGVVEDQEYGLWCASSNDGLFYLPNIFHKCITNPVLGENQYVSFGSSYKEELLGGSGLNGLFRIEQDGTEVFLDSLNDNWIKGVVKSADGLFGFGRHGLFSLDEKYHAVRQLSDMNFVGSAFDSDSSLLFMTKSDLFRLNGNSLDSLCSIPSGKANSILNCSDGRVLVGTNSNLFFLSGKKLVGCSVINNGTDTIKGTTSIIEDENGNLFISGGPESGLLFIRHGNDWHIINLNKYFALNNGAIYSVLVDKQNRIWANTLNKVFSFRYDFKTRSVSDQVVYSWQNGICSSEINNIRYFRDRIYVATTDGISVIENHPLNYNRTPPPTYIDYIEINNKRFAPGSVSELEYNQNNLRFFIDVLNYQSRGKPVYKYKLIGFDDSLQSGSDPSVYYSNLSPGDYQLIVIGINNNGYESKPVTFHFTIRPPFWLTWWFMSFSVLTFLLLVFLFIRYRIRIVRIQEEEKARINNQLAVSQMTALRAQMNPHFIFNAINSIQNFILRNEREPAYDYLAKFARLIRQVLHHTKDESVSIEDEIEMLQLYMDIEKLRFENVFTVEISIAPEVSPSETLIPGMLLQPFIENAIWHGLMPLNKTRPGKILLQFLHENEKLLIRIEDNGVGRAHKTAVRTNHRSMGIEISRKRLFLFTQQNKTEYKDIVFIDKKDAAGNPAGTVVEIRIADIH